MDTRGRPEIAEATSVVSNHQKNALYIGLSCLNQDLVSNNNNKDNKIKF